MFRGKPVRALKLGEVSIVDADRVWFAAAKGLDGVTQVGTEPGLCASAILGSDPYLLADASVDPRSLANPLVAGDLAVSRTLENMQLLLIQLGMKYNYNWLAGWKILHQ